MSDVLLHCFNCEAFNPQDGDALQCSQCQSDFVEIVQVERSPNVPGNRPASGTTQSEHNDSAGGEQGVIPGFGGMIGSLISSILPNVLPQAPEPVASPSESINSRTEPSSDTEQAARTYTDQPQPPPFNDFFSQMFGQFPQGRGAPSPLSDSTYTRTTHGPGGSSFTFTFGSSAAGGPAFYSSQPQAGANQDQAPNPFPFPGFPFMAGTNQQQGIPQIQNFPDLASFLTQALGGVPGRAGDYASGETFDNIISELMSRNPQSNVNPATDRAISQIKRLHLRKDARGLEGDKIGEECSICQDDYVDNDVLVELMCHHIYHEECLLNWVKTNGICPICRAPVIEVQETPEQDTLD